MWQETFPEAQIFGLDIREDTLVNEGNICSFLCDQSNPSDLLHAANQIGGDIDFIVDDASHVPAYQVQTACVFVPSLSKSGVYVIEDVIPGRRVFRLPSVQTSSGRDENQCVAR